MKDILIKIEDNTVGPLTESKLRWLIHQGTFTLQDLVWNERSGDWARAATLVEIAELFDLSGKAPVQQARLYAVASGKGGVGKTVITASTGVALASMGHKVIVVDCDFGGANLHTVMGILQPETSFDDYFGTKGAPLSDFTVETPITNLRLLSGSCGSLKLANLKYAQKQKFIRGLKKLNADFILMDLGGGGDFNVLDFYLLADEKLLVMNPDLAAVHGAFGFIRMALLRRLKRTFKDDPSALDILNDQEANQPGRIVRTMAQIREKLSDASHDADRRFQSAVNSLIPRLILNKAQSKADLDEAISIELAAAELLSVRVDVLGQVAHDPAVEKAVKEFRPFVLHSPTSEAAKDLTDLVYTQILGKRGIRERIRKRKWRQAFDHLNEIYPEVRLVDAVPVAELVQGRREQNSAILK